MKDLKTSIKCSKVDNCSLTLVLDKRTNKATDVYPLAICFQIAAKRYYYKLKDMDYQSEKYFNDVCSVKGAKSLLMPVRTEWQNVLEGYREKVEKLSQRQPLTLELIRTYLSGEAMEEHHETSFIGVWEGIIAKMKSEDRVGTAENYQWALNSFQKYAGDVSGFKVDKNVINKWNDAMQNGVYIDGVLTGKIADATRGMYLRTCRVVWNECIRQGFLTEDKYPFSNKDKTLISIPRGKRRQQSYLSVDEMTKLYQVFTEKNYPDTWDPAYKARAHESLGLFLAQYLCNGFNLTDAGRLQYNRTYFAEGGKAFEFMRKKTSARSNDMSVVIVPIIEPLQVILDEIGAKPEKDAYVFPQIFKGVTDESQRRKMTVQENSNIKDRMIRICKDVLGWDKVVSGTWARHSFATNLKLAGVEEQYISESMAHSHGNDVTSGYQDMYPLEIRFRNNSKLLNIGQKEESINIDKLSKKEMKELLLKMMTEKGI
ncbi:MAG: phage integrase SAM-like domain-containing protein [Prevotella sp.]|nr:phage integrase SAM-like domain-containing protein [Prevotella sp.]